MRISSLSIATRNGSYPSLDLKVIAYGVKNCFKITVSHKFSVHKNEFMSFIESFEIQPLSTLFGLKVSMDRQSQMDQIYI